MINDNTTDNTLPNYTDSLRTVMEYVRSQANTLTESYTQWANMQNTYVSAYQNAIGTGNANIRKNNFPKNAFVFIKAKYDDKFTLLFNICSREFILMKNEDYSIRANFKYSDLQLPEYQRFIPIVDNCIWPNFRKYLSECKHKVKGKMVFINEKCSITFGDVSFALSKVLFKTKSILEARAMGLDYHDISSFAIDSSTNNTPFPLNGTAFNIRKYVPDNEWQEFMESVKDSLEKLVKDEDIDMEEVDDSNSITDMMETEAASVQMRTINLADLLA